MKRDITEYKIIYLSFYRSSLPSWLWPRCRRLRPRRRRRRAAPRRRAAAEDPRRRPAVAASRGRTNVRATDYTIQTIFVIYNKTRDRSHIRCLLGCMIMVVLSYCVTVDFRRHVDLTQAYLDINSAEEVKTALIGHHLRHWYFVSLGNLALASEKLIRQPLEYMPTQWRSFWRCGSIYIAGFNALSSRNVFVYCAADVFLAPWPQVHMIPSVQKTSSIFAASYTYE